MTKKVPYYVQEIRKGLPETEQSETIACPRIMIAGTGDSASAENVAMGLLAVWEEQGLLPRGFSAGPSYRNLEALRLASGREAYTLDSWFHDEDTLSYLLTHYTEGHRVAVIDAGTAYFDTLSPLMLSWSDPEKPETPRGSAAELARLTKTPVVMVADAGDFSFTQLACMKGLLDFREGECVAGFILSGLPPERQEEVKRQVEEELELPVFGFISREAAELRFPSLSELLPEMYEEAVYQNLQMLTHELKMRVDTSSLLHLASKAAELDPSLPQALFRAQRFLGFEQRRCRIAVARDRAFSYYYRENLDLLNEMGADLIYFSPLNDPFLPQDIDGIYLGSGPLLDYLAEASNNETMCNSLYRVASAGLPVLAEGAGAVYLSRAFRTESGREWPLAAVLPGVASLNPDASGPYYAKMTSRRDDLVSEHGMAIPCLVSNVYRWQPEGASYRTAIRGKGHVMSGFSTPTIWACEASIHFYAQPMMAARFAVSCLRNMNLREQGGEEGGIKVIR